VRLSPCLLEPAFVPRIWGAKSLAPLFPQNPLGEGAAGIPIGEVWLSGNGCRFANGPFAKRALGEAWQEMPPEWTGTRAKTNVPFPLLVKFLFSEDKLSVQVHPNDDYARTHEAGKGGTGKTEVWYAVAAREDAEVFVGLRPGVTADGFRRAISDGKVENCLARLKVAAGDAIFVPAGTAHTIGAGMVLCEVQENSDLTYRVFDYNRRNPDGTTRELHIEKAMDVLDFGEQRGGKVQPARAGQGCCEITHYVACPYFAFERWKFASRVDFETDPEHFELFVVIGGAGRIVWQEGAMDYALAQAWFTPAALGAWRFEPAERTTVLRAFVPDLQRYAAQLSARGVSAANAARIIRQ
jgi:mannose-6-phosphate isomerase